jgi:hypothetical protein
MGQTIADYFRGFAEAVGKAWNRFWFLPSDAAPLAALRIIAGLVALYLHVTLSFDLVRLFGPNAILSSEIVRQLDLGPGPSYLHFLSTPTELWIAHLLGGVVLVLFTVGLWTRVTSVLAAMVMLASIHRGPLLTAEVELVLAFVLVYLCIGPSGAWLSLDAYRSRRRGGAATKSLSENPKTPTPNPSPEDGGGGFRIGAKKRSSLRPPRTLRLDI